jgi:hypothetical protein
MSGTSIAISSTSRAATIRAIALDIVALAFIFFMPALSHMLSIKLYLIEPMRLMVILAMVHTHRNNAYILALTLPLFSFLISSHPVLIKTGLISLELAVMVGAFFFLVKRIHTLAAIFVSIWASKIFYYGLKYLTILFIWPGDRLISTPLYIQLITSAVFSFYLFFMFRKKS